MGVPVFVILGPVERRRLPQPLWGLAFFLPSFLPFPSLPFPSLPFPSLLPSLPPFLPSFLSFFLPSFLPSFLMYVCLFVCFIVFFTMRILALRASVCLLSLLCLVELVLVGALLFFSFKTLSQKRVPAKKLLNYSSLVSPSVVV